MTLTEYLQIPFKHQGRDQQGVDCFGLVLLYYQNEFGITLKNFSGYDINWHNHGEEYFLSKLHDWNFRETSERPQRGDGILFTTKGRVSHCGVVLDDEYFLHMTKDGCAVHPWRQGYWSTMLHSVCRNQELI